MLKHTKNETIIQIPYAGLTRDDVVVEYQSGQLRVRPAKRYVEDRQYHVSSQTYDVEKISAEMSHGLLTITLPYKSVPEARKIEIK